ncbi:translation initiation factor 2 [Pseudomonas sp. MBLB4136]|uniref:translation initiation factor 2 n=1 Tax=Pseudomonas sp. MBLB4136 TaxID=3451558 RepID=UPI003F74E603
MRSGLLSLLFAIGLLPFHLHAEESPGQPLAQAQIEALEQRLKISEEQREALSAELLANNSERESAQVRRLRQENQRLKLQLKKAQADSPVRLLSEQQTWFAAGAGAGLLGVLIGALLRGNRRTRREWIN